MLQMCAGCIARHQPNQMNCMSDLVRVKIVQISFHGVTCVAGKHTHVCLRIDDFVSNHCRDCKVCRQFVVKVQSKLCEAAAMALDVRSKNPSGHVPAFEILSKPCEAVATAMDVEVKRGTLLTCPAFQVEPKMSESAAMAMDIPAVEMNENVFRWEMNQVGS